MVFVNVLVLQQFVEERVEKSELFVIFEVKGLKVVVVDMRQEIFNGVDFVIW